MLYVIKQEFVVIKTHLQVCCLYNLKYLNSLILHYFNCLIAWLEFIALINMYPYSD